MQFSRETSADLQTHTAARHKPGGRQGQALLFVDLAAQPALDIPVQVQIPFGSAPGRIALGGLAAFLFLRRSRAGLGGRLCRRLCLLLAGLLAVQLAVNILKNAAGKRVIEQIPQNILFSIGICGLFGLLLCMLVLTRPG